MTSFEDIQKLITKRLESLNFEIEPHNLYKPIEYSLSTGGKRIRPALTLMAYELFRYDIENAVNTAVGIEVFHNFTLLHDDIMDKSEMRRGQATVHNKWNPDIALLSGDAMSIMATSLINKSPRNQKEVMDAFTRAALDVCEGQQYDMDFENAHNTTEDDYLKMISLKTGALLAVSLKIGGLMADASKQDIENLYKLGISLGIGFQLQDDWLDCYGNQEEFGKPIGKDILNKKKTFLWIEAMEKADAGQEKQLLDMMQNDNIADKEKIDNILHVYKQLGIPQSTKNTVEACFDEAISYLDKIKVTEAQKNVLRQLLAKLKSRSH
ncbi:MAG: polyprenyl synthetase family protein [Bacteroidales bacterium]